MKHQFNCLRLIACMYEYSSGFRPPSVMPPLLTIVFYIIRTQMSNRQEVGKAGLLCVWVGDMETEALMDRCTCLVVIVHSHLVHSVQIWKFLY